MAQYEKASTELFLKSGDLDGTYKAVKNNGESMAFVGDGSGLKEAVYTDGVLGSFTDVATGDKYVDAITGLTAYIGNADAVQDTNMAGVIISMNRVMPPASTRAGAIAKYKILGHTLTYNANSGAGAPSAVTIVDAGATAKTTISATVPTYSAHTFLGWGTSAGATTATYEAGDEVIIPSAGITLYAVWEAD
jgi:hypothetical protein